MTNGLPESSSPPAPNQPTKGGVQLKKRVSLFNGIALIVNVIVGSGIFVSPTAVLAETHAGGISLAIWTVCGLYATLGALCYAELGTTMPRSGGDFVYLTEAWGPLPAFLFVWAEFIAVNPSANAIMALTAAEYGVSPFYADSGVKAPHWLVLTVACTVIVLTLLLNILTVYGSTRCSNILSVSKVLALLFVFALAIIFMAQGNTDHVHELVDFHSPTFSFLHIANAFYGGIFSYAGWVYLNFVTEEIRDPEKNLPRAIFIALPLITVVYLLANCAYLSVLTPEEILASPAVAASLARRVAPSIAWIVPILVAASCIGSLNSVFFSASRLYAASAGDKQFPRLIGMRHVKWETPIPALLALGATSLLMTVLPLNLGQLITYLSFIETLIILMSITGLVKLRFTRKDMRRPIKLPILLPIIFIFAVLFVVVMPFFTQTVEMLCGVGIFLSGVPIYLLFLWRGGAVPTWVTSTSWRTQNCLRAVLNVASLAKEEGRELGKQRGKVAAVTAGNQHSGQEKNGKEEEEGDTTTQQSTA